jgi:hypothetical protein
VSHASGIARQLVENNGGSLNAVYYNRLALRALLVPHRYTTRLIPRNSVPPPKLRPRFDAYKNAE